MKQQGFTLIELIICCAIIVIINLSFSSSFAFILDKARVDKDIVRLLLMVQTTRQYSINQSSTTVLCPSQDQKNCIRNWKLPLMLFHDTNKNTIRDPNEIILNSFDAFNEDDIQIYYPKSQIRFNESGMANFYNGTLSYCLKQHIEGIIISRIGRIRLAQDLDGDHIPDVRLGTPVNCR